MKLSKAMVSLAMLVAAFGAGEARAAQTSYIPMNDDPEYDAAFRCPEAIPAAQRSQAAHDFIEWAHSRHPDWTLAEMVRYRLELFERHNCEETLRRLRSAVAPPAEAAPANAASP